MALVDSISYSFIIVMTRKLKEIPFTIVNQTYGAIATYLYVFIAVIIFALDAERQTYPSFFYYQGKQWVVLITLSVINAIAISFATLAFQKGKSVFISILGLIIVVYAFFIDVLIFKTSFSLAHILGAVIIVGFNIVIFMGKAKDNQNEKDKEVREIEK